MKKIALIFVLLFNLVSTCPTAMAENNIYYGRALTSGVYLYKEPEKSSDILNRLFEIPKTYFVQLLSSENEDFYKACYNGIYGFVLKNEVSAINQTPRMPYVLDHNFRVFTPGGANLRTSPVESKGTTNLLTAIPFMDTNLLYYGKTEGEEAISYKGTTWYYCKYVKQNIEYIGYIYSPLCDLLDPIAPNEEVYEYVVPNFITEDNTNLPASTYLSISSPWQIIIIVLISLPCIGLIYFLFKPTKILTQKSTTKSKPIRPQRKKKKIARLKHSDYYELEDLNH